MLKALRRALWSTERIEARLARIELKLEVLLERTGAITGPAIPLEVRAALQSGKRAEAVRLYQAARGVSPYEADLAVEACAELIGPDR